MPLIQQNRLNNSRSCVTLTGKSLLEALLFAEHGENMLCTKIVLNVSNKAWNFMCIEFVIQ